MCIDTLNHFGLAHECDRQTDRQTDGETKPDLAIAQSNVKSETDEYKKNRPVK